MSNPYRHHRYTWSKPFGSVRHSWGFTGPRGAISFNVSLTEGYGPSCGLEFHHTREEWARQGREEEAPHHLNCEQMGGPCWHDGTSLYAQEQVWPFVRPHLEGGDHDIIFRYLEGEADRHFGHVAEGRS